jgi:16S rRNA (guanine1207-N2)-methyltransferase
MRVNRGDRVLDLGCGNGIVGTVGSILSGSGDVTLVDVDVDSLDAARATTLENGQARASIVASDSISAVADRKFDVIVTNPPFHLAKETDFDVAQQFIRDSACVLNPAGRFYLVANRFIPYEGTMKEAYPKVETVAENSRFKVLIGFRRAR